MRARWISAAMRVTGSLILVCGLNLGQTGEKRLAFDAASVKPAAPSAAGPSGMVFGRTIGGPGTKDPGRIRYSSMGLKALLLIAYHLNDFQLSGPAWLETARFDIDATMPPDTTPEQFRSMLQTLLSERFKLALHRETRQVPAYALTLVKSGLRMVESAQIPNSGGAAAPAGAEAHPPIKLDADGFPILPSGQVGMLQFVVRNRARVVGHQQTIHELAERLSDLIGRPVTDATALVEKYDFSLTFAAEGTALGRLPAGDATYGDTPPAEMPPDLFTAVQSQLGLKLEPKKGTIEVIVIDHAERTPVEN